MGKNPIDNLKKIDVQLKIKDAMDKRNDQIRRLLGYDPKTESSVIIGAIPIVASIVFFMAYFLLALYDTTKPIWAVLKWTIMLSIYMPLVFYIHSLTFKSVNLFNVIYSLIPIIVIKILLLRWPSASSPIDNTLGVLYNSYFGPTSRLLQHVKYEPLTGEPFNKISFPFDKIQLDWLIDTINSDNIDNLLKKEDSKEGIIPNIYIQPTVDSEGEDVYGYEDVKSDLDEIVKWKRYIGHMTYDYIGFILGLAYSVVLSVPS